METEIGSCNLGQTPVDDVLEGCSNQTDSPGIVFPDTAVQKILKNSNFDQQTLLNCRLVCVQWNETIKDTSALMKKITFTVSNPRAFLELGIVGSGKVKSIKFKNCSRVLASEHLDGFFDAIHNSVEKVEYGFIAKDQSSTPKMSAKLFQLVLQKCLKLEELIVRDCFTMYEDDYGRLRASAVFCGITASTEIKAANKIKRISVELNVLKTNNEDAVGLSALLLKLPNLQEIEALIFCNLTSECQITIFNGLSEYLKRFGPAHQLKKMTLAHNSKASKIVCDPTLITLLILCGRYNVQVNKLPTINLSSILDEELDLSELKASSHCLLFPMKFNATFTFPKDEELSNLNRLHFLNTQNLQLIFERDVTAEELNWIRSIQCLESLGLRPRYGGQTPFEKLNSNSVRELEESFSAGMPFLKILHIDIEIFEYTRIHRWPEYFPNLNKLFISDCDFVPNDLISQLTVLESLSHLFLLNLENLTDAAFTAECLNRFVPEQQQPPLLALGPAISCFRSLKFLQLDDLPLLTDACVRDGISKCESLEKLVINICENMTKNCLGLMICKVEFDQFD